MTRSLKALRCSGLAKKEGRISSAKHQLLSYSRKENSLQVITCPPRLPKTPKSLLKWEKKPTHEGYQPQRVLFSKPFVGLWCRRKAWKKNTLSTMRKNWRRFKLRSFRKNLMHFSVTIWEFLSSNPGWTLNTESHSLLSASVLCSVWWPSPTQCFKGRKAAVGCAWLMFHCGQSWLPGIFPPSNIKI